MAKISADNGSISGVPGLTLTGDVTGILQFLTGANTATLTLNTDQSALFAGQMSAPEIAATNGIVGLATNINTNYTVATGTNAFSMGPVVVTTGTSVTVATGQRWVIL